MGQMSDPSVLGDLKPSKQTPSKEQRRRCSPTRLPHVEVRSERSLMRENWNTPTLGRFEGQNRWWFCMWPSVVAGNEKSNSVHIGNHLYCENQKRWGTIPDDLSEVFYSRGTSIPSKNPDDCQTFFFIILQYSAYPVRNLKRKQNGLVPSLNCQTSGCYCEHTGPHVQVKMENNTLLASYTTQDAASWTRTELICVFLLNWRQKIRSITYMHKSNVNLTFSGA